MEASNNGTSARRLLNKLQQRPAEPLRDNSSILESKSIISGIIGTAAYDEIAADLRTNMPETIQPESVGSYLYGCGWPQSDVPSLCTPSCINGLNMLDDECDVPVYERTIHGLTKLNSAVGNRAYIFCTGDKPITPSEKITLHRAGVTNADIFNRDTNTIRYRKIGKYTPHVDDSTTSQTSVSDLPYKSAEGWGSTTIIGLIILVIFIIVVIGMLYYASSSGTSTTW